MKIELATSQTLAGIAAPYIPASACVASAAEAVASDNRARVRSFGAIRRLEPTVAA